MKNNNIKNNSSTENIFEYIRDISGSSSLGKTAEKFKEDLLVGQVIEEQKKEINKINKENRQFQEEYLEKIKDQYRNDFEAKSKDLEYKIENSKLSVIETLGMFVALFTFISVDFQVFKSYRDPMAIGALTSILIGAIFLFIIFFDYFILQARKVNKTEENIDSKKYIEDGRVSRTRKVMFCVSLILIFLGIFIFSRTKSDELNDNKDQIKKEILSSVKSDLDSQKSELEKTNNDNKIIIEETNESVADFKRCVRNFGFTYKCFEEK